MAYIPTEAEVNKLLEQAQKAEDKKLASQEKQGKTFVNNGQGVIPESAWVNLPGKKVDDPESTEGAV